MTRVTNFGIKRTHVQAGFGDAAPTVDEPTVPEPNGAELPAPPPKKKRKRTKMSQRDGNKAKNLLLEGSAEAALAFDPSATAPPKPRPAPKANPKKSAQIISSISVQY